MTHVWGTAFIHSATTSYQWDGVARLCMWGCRGHISLPQRLTLPALQMDRLRRGLAPPSCIILQVCDATLKTLQPQGALSHGACWSHSSKFNGSLYVACATRLQLVKMDLQTVNLAGTFPQQIKWLKLLLHK